MGTSGSKEASVDTTVDSSLSHAKLEKIHAETEGTSSVADVYIRWPPSVLIFTFLPLSHKERFTLQEIRLVYYLFLEKAPTGRITVDEFKTGCSGLGDEFIMVCLLRKEPAYSPVPLLLVF